MGNSPGQTFGNCRFTHARLTHQQRVVFAATAQDLNHALDFVFATDQRVNLAVFGQLIQIDGVLLQRRSFFILLAAAFFSFSGVLAGLCSLRRVVFLDTVSDKIHHIQAGHTLLVEVIHRVRIFLAKDGNQHIGASHFFLAAAGGLHMHDGALNHALKTQRRLSIYIVCAGHLGRVVFDEVGQRLAQVLDIRRAGSQNFGSAGVVQQCQQQVLDGDEFMPLLTRFHKRHMQTDFQFLGDHVGSFCLALMINCKPF